VTPCIETEWEPRAYFKALSNGGPTAVPTVPVSVVPRAKMTVTSVHALASIEPVGAAKMADGRRRRDRNWRVWVFILRSGWMFWRRQG
jgi:hypothetical protein